MNLDRVFLGREYTGGRERNFIELLLSLNSTTPYKIPIMAWRDVQLGKKSHSAISLFTLFLCYRQRLLSNYTSLKVKVKKIAHQLTSVQTNKTQ